MALLSPASNAEEMLFKKCKYSCLLIKLSVLILAIHSLIHLIFTYLLSIGHWDLKDSLCP